eukprot:GCRY01001073.1.p1 GENE.GCRY01001073.1~~GCRY01001073.1.p1  ORF type:complete len:235 (-),score=24.82 GCRY01001073.1:84-788(-)
MSIVNFRVTTEVGSKVALERYYDLSLTIEKLKDKLLSLTGINPSDMILTLYDSRDQFVANLSDPGKMLGYYGPGEWYRIHVGSTVPDDSAKWNDLSKVEKFELTSEQYAQRDGTVKQFIEAQNKAKGIVKPSQEELDSQYQKEAAEIAIGNRFEDDQGRRGEVAFVGRTAFSTGYWVGLRFDEPVGKNDGSVQGKQYFECENKYGSFVRPNRIRVGDYPERDIFDELEDSEDEI